MPPYLIVKSKRDTKNIAKKLAPLLKRDSTLVLMGDLGAGKTYFSQCLINILLNTNQVITSPTFNLINIYNTKTLTIWHCDLYRLEEAEEVYPLGLNEALGENLCIIEWPEKILNLLPKATIFIKITLKEKERFFEIFSEEKAINTKLKEVFLL